jgi:hypothetical protein
MQGIHTPLNVEIALDMHRNRIAEAESHRAIVLAQRHSTGSRLASAIAFAGSSLIAIGERLRDRGLRSQCRDVGVDMISPRIAR